MPDCEVEAPEEWSISVLPAAPIAPPKFSAPSVFYSDAREVEAKPNLKQLTYNYHHATTWFIAGAQILAASGWQPDCTRAKKVNVSRTIPPPVQLHAPIITHSMDHMRRRPEDAHNAPAP